MKHTLVSLCTAIVLVLVSTIVVFAYDYTIDSAYWDCDSDTGTIMGRWDKCESSTTYTVCLYFEDEDEPLLEKSVSGSAYNFGIAIAKKNKYGDYRFTVYPNNGGESHKAESDTVEIDKEFMSAIKKKNNQNKKPAEPEKKGNNTGTNTGTTTGGPNGPGDTGNNTKAKFTGWRSNPNCTWSYYIDDVRQTRKFVDVDGYRYYLDSNGIMSTGWAVINNNWYYFETNKNSYVPEGAMYRNTTFGEYTLDSEGRWVYKGQIQLYSEYNKNNTDSSSTNKTSYAQQREANRNSATKVSKIGVVNININSTKYSTDAVYNVGISASSSKVENISYSKPIEQWSPNETVNISFDIVAENNYIFASSTKYTCTEGCSITSNTGSDIVRRITITYRPKVTLSKPTNFYITDYSVLHWDKVEFAKRYRIEVSEDNTQNKKFYVTTNSVDLSECCSDFESASVAIYADGPEVANNKKSNYVASEGFVIDNVQEFIDSHSVEGELSQSGSKLTYVNEMGEDAEGWYNLGGYWYFFKKGKAVGKGWFKDSNGSWYYFDKDHRMVTGWIEDGGYNYYLYGSGDAGVLGSMATGYVVLSNKPRFFNDGSVSNYPLGAYVEGR